MVPKPSMSLDSNCIPVTKCHAGFFFSLKLAQRRQMGFGVFSSKQLALPSGRQLSGLVSLQLNSPVCSRYSTQYVWCPVVSGKGNSQYPGAPHGECQQLVAVFLCCLNSGKGPAGSQVSVVLSHTCFFISLCCFHELHPCPRAEINLLLA